MKARFLMSFSILFLNSCKQDEANTYTLDIFSLLSFALAIASILFAGFAIWLSWELYKKSTAASDKTQEAVIRIESAVLSIKGDITEIVKRAVSYWVQDNPDAEEIQTTSHLTEKLDELLKASSDQANVEALKELVEQEISKALIDAKVKNIFPSATSASAISLYQEILENTATKKSGQLIIRINRPIKIATATGKFTPSFNKTPILEVKLTSSPYKSPSTVLVTSGIGQFSDFHVHLKIQGSYLAEGEYIVEYSAQLP